MVQSKKKKAKSTAKKSAKKEKEHGEEKKSPTLAENTTKSSPENVFDEVEDYAIIVLDPSGKITTWNKGAAKIKGYTAGEIIGKNHRIFYTQEDKETNLSEKLLREAKRAGRTNYEGWRVKKDGTRFWGNVTLTALHNESGGIRGFLKVTRDLTEKKLAEDNYSNYVEELKLKNEELRKSEERYHRMIAEVADYAIILLDKDGKVLDWNKGAEKLKGYTAKEIIGKSFRMFYPRTEKDSGLPEKLLAEAVANGSTVHEGWRITKEGKRFWGFVTITALHDDEGNIIGFSKVTRDLTEKKLAEDKVGNVMEELRQANDMLKESEERYHKMISEVQDYAIILLDVNGDIQNWNVGAENIKGYKASEIVGKNFRSFYSKQDQDQKLPEKLLNIAIKHGKANHEGWRVRKDRTTFWGSVVITALHSGDGQLIGFSKVTRDLTERKLNEDMLKANAAQLDLKNKTLERLNDELSSFTHVASHDLKEPLRKIKAFASKIDLDQMPEKDREYLGKITASAARMQTLIDDLLAYSRINRDAAHFEKVNLNNVLQAVKVDLEVSIGEKNAVIISDRLPIVSGVPHQLEQLFLNLLSNSIKFAKEGETPRIDIHSELIKGPNIPGHVAENKNRYYHITVRDNGIGFDNREQDKIFEAFFRLHSKQTYTGTGVGLATVKRVVENHNGIVNAESSPGEGATFHVYLPADVK